MSWTPTDDAAATDEAGGTEASGGPDDAGRTDEVGALDGLEADLQAVEQAIRRLDAVDHDAGDVAAQIAAAVTPERFSVVDPPT